MTRAYRAAIAALACAMTTVSFASVRAAAVRAATTVVTDASPTPATAMPPTIAVRGRLLSVGHGFVVFNDGRALRLRAGTDVPRGTTLGSDVRATLDRVRHDVVALERDPRTAIDGEIAIADLPSTFVVGRSAATPAPIALGIAPAIVTGAAPRDASGTIAYALTVEVPANTPPGDDVYVATDRSNFSPSEIRMQRVGSRRFTVTISVAADGHVRYEFTRGTYATVERDRSGGIVSPHAFDEASGRTIETTVARWADLD